MLDLSGKTALITGASRGIGAATARMMARAGANVVVHFHRNQAGAEKVCEAIREIGREATPISADLTSLEQTRSLFDAASQLGQMDIVVMNSGIWRRAPIDEMQPEQWREMMATNLDAAYHVSQCSAILFKQQRYGKLVFVGSTAGVRGEAFHSHYAATKGALMSLTRSLAVELAPFQINVNCVSPGWVLTDMTESVFADQAYKETVTQAIPVGRIATPDDIAGAITFLASDLARHIQGENLNVNGGAVMG
jgi:3-oxoacyl-[acyl-carrier protein] reductase